MEMKRRGLRIALGKVRRRKPHYLPPVRVVVLIYRDVYTEQR